ncbi:MAG: DNA-processing protein DprA [Tannerellaceae bacterium]|jgi:DNA processing protein|nr:DNA-processing protein DprA [Tannerellaceae bacterium]
MADGKDIYRIGLTMTVGVGEKIAKRLLELFDGDAEAVFREKEHILGKVAGVGAIVSASLHNPETLRRAEAELRFVEQNNIRIVFLNEEGYPFRLAQCPDAPILLYYKGEADLDATYMVSIVGTRSATVYGQGLTDKFVHDLGEMLPETHIVSGLAYGIDIMSHRAALKEGLRTVAILAHGLDRIYPSVHRTTAVEMLREGGGLLTEYPHGTTPEKLNFVKRNRIVAGLSEAVVVVESPHRGGSLITADMALGYARSVFAFPGRTTDSHSTGCNDLIRYNKAALILSATHFVSEMGWTEQSLAAAVPQELPFVEEGDAGRVLAILRTHEDAHIDHIGRLAEMPMSKLLPTLLDLEVADLIIQLPGNRYRIAST